MRPLKIILEIFLSYVITDATLYLTRVNFKKNFICQNSASCIYTGKKGRIFIDSCKFLNHTSRAYPYSAHVINAGKYLNIKSTKLENNKPQGHEIRSISVRIKIFNSFSNSFK